jgi:Flp pilus assembly pilin Flp
MQSAGDIRRADQRHHSLVYLAFTFTEIGIYIDLPHWLIVRRFVTIDGFVFSAVLVIKVRTPNRRRQRQAGQSFVEYAVILVLVACVVVVTLLVLGNTLQNTYWNLVASFDTSGRPVQQISCEQGNYNCQH